MKKILLSAAAALVIAAPAIIAQAVITKVDKIAPTDQVYMDMATEAAKSAKKAGKKADGAVVILNNAFHSSGKPSGDTSAVQDAIGKARVASLENAKIYTVNEPTTEALNAISRRKAQAVYFVNSREDVVKAGIYPAEAYDDSKIDTTVTQVPMHQMAYDAASKLIGK